MIASACYALETAATLLREKIARAPRERPVRSILVIGYAAIGDFLFFLPTMRGLRAAYPKAKIVFIANRYPTTVEILPVTGLVDDIWFFDWEGPEALSEKSAINARIAEAGFDLALLTLSAPAHFFSSGLRAIPLRAGHLRDKEPGASWLSLLKRRLVTGEYARRALLNRRVELAAGGEHAVLRNLRLLSAIGQGGHVDAAAPKIPLTPEQERFAESVFVELDPAKKKIGIHLGPQSNPYFKIWPAERWAEACRRLARRRPLEFIAVGGSEEAESVLRARRVLPELRATVGQCGLLETFALIKRCDLFLSNDTGLAKAAMILGVPTATVWGPTDPAELGILWEPGKHLDIRTGIACSPCVVWGMSKLGALNYANCGHHDCLAQLDEDWLVKRLAAKYPFLV